MKQKIIMILCALAIGFGASWYLKLKNESKSEVINQKNIITVVKEVIKKDGSKEIVTTITDKSKNSTTVVLNQPKYKISAIIESDFKNIKPIYGAQLEKRFAGPVWIGITYKNNGGIGANVGVEF